MIIRGTTPYHSFIIPMKLDLIDSIIITYAQNNEKILDKTDNDIDLQSYEDFLIANEVDINDITDEEKESSIAIVHLSEEDTYSFTFYPAAKRNIAMIQLKLKDTNNEVYASKPIRERIYNTFNDSIMGE